MKTLSKISILFVILFLSLGCNLTGLIGNKEAAPTETASSNDVVSSDVTSCIAPSSLNSEYSPVDVNLTPESQQLDQVTSLLKSVFKDAKISQYGLFVNEGKTKVISCVKLEPIGTLEKTTFDLLLKNPDSFMNLIDIPELKIGVSSLSEEYSQIGDKSAFFHISFGSDNPKSAELLVTRTKNSISIYSFIYGNNKNDLEDFKSVLNTLQ